MVGGDVIAAEMEERLVAMDRRNIAFSVQCALVRDYIHLNSFAYDLSARVTFNLVAIFTHFHAAFAVHPGFARCHVVRVVVPADVLASHLGSVALDDAVDALVHRRTPPLVLCIRQGDGHRLLAITLRLDAARDVVVLLMPDLATDDPPDALAMHVFVLDRAHRFPVKTLTPPIRTPVQCGLATATAARRSLSATHTHPLDAVHAARALVLELLSSVAPMVARGRLWARLRSSSDVFGGRLAGPEFVLLLSMVDVRDVAALDASVAAVLCVSEGQWRMVLDGLLSRDRHARVVAADLADPCRAIAQSDTRHMHLILFHELAPHVAVHAHYDARQHGMRVSLLRCGGDAPDVARQSLSAEAALLRKLVHHITNLLWRSVSA